MLLKQFGLRIVTGFLFAYSANLLAINSTYTVTPQSTIQNMVANSSQNIVYTLSTEVAPPQAVNVNCAFTSSNPALTASFNNNGCTSEGGIGINSQLPATIALTITVAPNASGTLTGTVTFQQTNGRTQPKIFSIPITVKTAARTIKFTNHCPSSVWFGISSSSVPAKNTGNIPCTTNAECSHYTYSLCVNGACGGGACVHDSDCLNSHSGTCAVPAGSPPGTTATCSYCDQPSDCLAGADCDTTNHQCFWKIPAPTDADTNHYLLNQNDSDSITIPDHSDENGYALQWGGGFAGRTHCTFANSKLTCATANCNTNGTGDGNGGCNLGEGFDAPATQAEVTFVATQPDTYDITIINGENIPMAMGPSTGSAPSPQTYNNPYLCGKAGDSNSTVTQAGTLGGCSWNFNPPSVAFRWVDKPTAPPPPPSIDCTDDSYCQTINTAYRCGLTTDAITNNSAQTTCGNPLGYWNQNEICAKNASYNQASIINCTLTNIANTGNSIINLLGCTGNAATSCYNVSQTTTTCCGCTNWQDQGIVVPSNSAIVAQCQFPDVYWGAGSAPSVTGYVLPGLIWLKQACPSAYVYPFDDKSSTFTCPSNNGQSGVDYTIDFCP